VGRQALIEEAPAPAVLVNNSTGNNKRAVTAPQQPPSQASALEMLRRAFLGLGPDPEQPPPAGEDKDDKRGPRIPDPAPEIQNPKASPLPVPPIEGEDMEGGEAVAPPPLVAEEVLSTLPLPRPAGAAPDDAADAAGTMNTASRDLRRRKRANPGPPPQCDPTLEWTSVNGQLMANGRPFHLKGTNWFGYETAQRMPFGLDEHDMDFYFRFLADHKFNALRVPLSVDFALDPDGKPDKIADTKVGACTVCVKRM
jgi:hypothetical protein